MGNKICEEQIYILSNFLFKKYQQLMSDLEEMYSRKTLLMKLGKGGQ